MANENEPAKLLLPYLQRADELQKHEPLVAYYCRLYAMERGLKIAQSGRTKAISSLLISLMNQLEKDKKSLKLGPEDGLYLEGFASNVFGKADKQDRAGRADLNTAKTFYAASIFFEILSQFGELQPDLEQKQKYAGWKAADIRKALKEGRKPEPGPPADHVNMSGISSTTNGSYGQLSAGISSSKSSHSSTGYSSPDFHPSSHKSEKSQYSPEPPLHFPPQEHEQFFPKKYTSRETSASPEPSPTPASTYQYDSNYLPPPEKIIEAHKAAKFAVGALAFNDVAVAVDFLKQSLELLTNPSAGQASHEGHKVRDKVRERLFSPWIKFYGSD